MSKNIVILLLLFLTSNLNAQVEPNVYYINFKSMLPYVIPFYGITIVALGLFLHKLMRPKFPSRWLYICTITGILGSGMIAYKFHEIRVTELPSYEPKSAEMEGLTNEMKEKVIDKQRSDMNETVSNYWTIAIPNFILLGLGLGLDWRNRKDNAEK